MKPEARFDELSAQERAWSRRVRRVLLLGLAPSLLLAVLGYHDAAGQVLFVTLLIGPLVAYGVTKLEEIDAILEPLRTTRGRREALLYLLAYLVYALGTSCLGRLFDRS